MKLIFEKSVPGRGLELLPQCDVPEAELPQEHKRTTAPRLPEVSENDISRHYTQLAGRAHGVNDGFYPLGSCTMKYNPKVHERIAALPGFSDLHPLCAPQDAQGALEAMHLLQVCLREITGMDEVCLAPAAGAHGELTGVLLIKAYHEARGDSARTKILVPDSAHGTNPATAAMANYQVVNVPSGPDGRVDLEALRAACGPDTAGLMLTNPNTLGLFERDILAITTAVHEAGGLCYYDGANLNAVMGIARPGDMGFDVVHLNLHKTFSTPHGGGGPGSGPVGCKQCLAPFLPFGVVGETPGGFALGQQLPQSIGRVRSFQGNFLVYLKALCYILSLGGDGLRQASEGAVLAANYMRRMLEDAYAIPHGGYCMHEFVLSLEDLKKQTGVSALDLAKGLLDYGIHPPTMYFPLIVPEALMVEPTETESIETLDEAVKAFLALKEAALKEPQSLHEAPKTTPVRRLDEVRAARNPVLRYSFEE